MPPDPRRCRLPAGAARLFKIRRSTAGFAARRRPPKAGKIPALCNPCTGRRFWAPLPAPTGISKAASCAWEVPWHCTTMWPPSPIGGALSNFEGCTKTCGNKGKPAFELGGALPEHGMPRAWAGRATFCRAPAAGRTRVGCCSEGPGTSGRPSRASSFDGRSAPSAPPARAWAGASAAFRPPPGRRARQTAPGPPRCHGARLSLPLTMGRERWGFGLVLLQLGRRPSKPY